MHFCLLGRFDFFFFYNVLQSKSLYCFSIASNWIMETFFYFLIFFFHSFFFVFPFFVFELRKKNFAKNSNLHKWFERFVQKFGFGWITEKKLLMKCFLWVFFSLVSKMSIMVIADNTNKHIIIRLISTICFCFETTVNQNLLHSFYFHISFLSFVSFHFAIA